MHIFPKDKYGIPEYYEQVSRSLKGKKDPNLIYPSGEGVFIHVLLNPNDVRNNYIPVEPCLSDAQDDFLDNLETRLADFVEELDGVAEAAKRMDIVMSIIDRIVIVRGKGAGIPDS